MTNLAIAENDDSARIAKAIDHLVSDDIRSFARMTDSTTCRAKALITEASDKREALWRKADERTINADDIAVEAKVIQDLLFNALQQLLGAINATSEAHWRLDTAVKYATGEYD